MTSLTPEHINAASDLADLIDAQDPPRMFYVPDSEGFERRIRRHAITTPRHRPPSALDLVDFFNAIDPWLLYAQDSEGFKAALDLLKSRHQKATALKQLQRSVFSVLGPDGFLLPYNIPITTPRHRPPSPAELQFVKACGERLRVRLAAAIPET